MSHDAPQDSAQDTRPSLPWDAFGRLGIGQRNTHGLSARGPARCCSGRQAVRLPGKRPHPLASLIDSSPRGFGLGVFSPALSGQRRSDAALPCAGPAQVVRLEAFPPYHWPGASAPGRFSRPRRVASVPPPPDATRRGCDGCVFWRAPSSPQLGPVSRGRPVFPAPSVRRRQVCQHLAAAGRSSIGAAGAPMGRSRCAEPSPLRHGQPLVEMLAVAERRGRTPTRSHDHGR